MRFALSPPPEVKPNDTESTLRSIRDYLYQMVDQLNAAGNALDSENFTVEGLNSVATAASNTSSQIKTLNDEAAALRSLIIKTADIVNSEIESITHTLTNEYVAKSEYGDFEASVRTRFQETGEGLELNTQSIETLRTNQESADVNFQEYKTNTESRIRIGKILMEDGTYVDGVAIGTDITTTVDGQTEYITAPAMSTFTASELAFWVGSNKVAWFTANQLCVSGLLVNGDIQQNDWIIRTEGNKWTLKYIG